MFSLILLCLVVVILILLCFVVFSLILVRFVVVSLIRNDSVMFLLLHMQAALRLSNYAGGFKLLDPPISRDFCWIQSLHLLIPI